MKRTTLLAAVLSSVLVLLSAGPASAATVTRIAGANQYETAIAVSRALVPDPARGPKAAVVVSGDDGADVLVGPAVAGELLGGAPLLMVRSDQPLERIVEDELRRLQVQRVVIVGGTNRVDRRVEDRIRTFTPSVERINGADRYETAARVSQRYAQPDTEVEVFVLTGEANTEAVAGVLAAAQGGGAVVLLTRKDTLPRATADELRRLRPGFVNVVGGTSVISTSVRRQIRELAPNLFYEQGRDGANRYDTQADLLYDVDRGSAERIFLVSGETWMNALVAAAYTRALPGPDVVLMTRKSCVPDPVLGYAGGEGYVDRDRTVIGGTGNVSDAAADLRPC